MTSIDVLSLRYDVCVICGDLFDSGLGENDHVCYKCSTGPNGAYYRQKGFVLDKVYKQELMEPIGYSDRIAREALMDLLIDIKDKADESQRRHVS